MQNKATIILFFLVSLVTACTPMEPEPETFPFIIFKTGSGFIADGSSVPPGGTVKIGISATGGGAAITNLVVKREADGVVSTEADRGMYIVSGGLDTTLIYTRGYANTERWKIFIMNSLRDTATATLTVLKGSGSAWGEINYYPSVVLGMQSNVTHPCYLDLASGTAYTKVNVTGNEAAVDLSVFWYLTSGISSPTLTCPSYLSALTWFPEYSSWPVRNQTLYDYYSSDNDLVSETHFAAAENDSLLVTAYRSQTVSGQSKFAYTGKIVPFRTSSGRYGLLKVIRADERADGTMEVAIKIQK